MKLTEMTSGELFGYIAKYEKRQRRYLSGSKNWLKCHKKIKKAKALNRSQL